MEPQGRILSSSCFFFQAEDGIRDLVRSRGLGDVYKRQRLALAWTLAHDPPLSLALVRALAEFWAMRGHDYDCLLYTSDAADERSSVDLGGRRIIKKKTYGEKQEESPLETQQKIGL